MYMCWFTACNTLAFIDVTYANDCLVKSLVRTKSLYEETVARLQREKDDYLWRID